MLHEIFETLYKWAENGHRFVLATVLETWGSAPRSVGAVMAVREDHLSLGSVSGGCVEATIIDMAQKVLAANESTTYETAVTNEAAWEVGLSCGGTIKVLIEPVSDLLNDPDGRKIWDALANTIQHQKFGRLVTDLQTPASRHLLVHPNGDHVGDWGDDTTNIVHFVQKMDKRHPRVVTVGERKLFVRPLLRPETLLVVGAVHIAQHLIKFAQEVDFRTVLIDPRQTFANPERFPVPPDRIIVEWPEPALQSLNITTDHFAVSLAHDPRIDDAALHVLLRSPVSYIGALGSQRTHVARCQRLRDAGFSATDIIRIKGPVGLDIHARTPAEIALSIIAEVIKAKHERRS